MDTRRFYGRWGKMSNQVLGVKEHAPCFFCMRSVWFGTRGRKIVSASPERISSIWILPIPKKPRGPVLNTFPAVVRMPTAWLSF